MVCVRLLGPLQLELEGEPVPLGAPKQRALLALLALDAGRTVPMDRLVEGLWGAGEPPSSATKMVQLYVSQLRKVLPPGNGGSIVTHGRGYALEADPDAVDALRFERLVAGGDAHAALALWRGTPLADLRDEPFAEAEVRRLEGLHLAASELALEADLAAGRHVEALAALEPLVAAHPLRERLHALRVLALYRAGRQADALEAYRTARRALVDEVGVEPGPELRRLHEAVLAQDPELDLAVPDREWARRATAGRLDAGAERAARHRADLREAEADVAAGVADLEELRGASVRDDGVPVCPFKGLAPFDVADAGVFFGRDRLVAAMVARLAGTTLLGVVGPSGSGKSSAVRAGLLPALARGVLPGSAGWRQVLLRPGADPPAALERALGGDVDAALAALPADARLVVAVDQFEELFTACRDEARRRAFADALADAAGRADRRVLVVLALRADLYGACAPHPRLAHLLAEGHLLVGPMQPHELARAIEGPARQAGLEVEPELVARLVADVAEQSGGLPVLSTTLLELWEDREGRRLTLAAYERRGGVEGAVARLAERAYDRLDADGRAAARRVLLRLAGAGEGDAVVRRRVPLSELGPGAGDVLEVLAAGRLVTVDEDAAEVAHEALLREWPRLREWLEHDAVGRRLHRHLTLAAQDWERDGCDPGGLYRGARLAAALDWAAHHEQDLNGLEHAFLAAARRAGQAEAERSRAVNRRLRALLGAAAVALVTAVAAGAVALDQRGDARGTAVVADAQRLGAQALNEDDVDRAMLLARAGVALDDTAATRGNLLSVLLDRPAGLLGVLRGSSDASVYDVAISPDGRRLAIGDSSGAVSFVDLRTRRTTARFWIGGRPNAPGLVQQLAWSPDGGTVAVTGQAPPDRPAGALAVLLDARTAQPRWRTELPPVPGIDVVIATPAFAGGALVVAQTHFGFGAPPPVVLRSLDLATGRPTGRRAELGTGTTLAVAAEPDGRHLLVASGADDATFRVDARTLRVVRRWPGAGGVAVAAAPDGRSFAVGRQDGSVAVVDAATGAVRPADGRHAAGVLALAFTPDGRRLASSGDTGDVVAREVAGGGVERFDGHREGVFGLAVTPDGRTLISGGSDARAVLWDLAGDQRLARSFVLSSPYPTDSTPRPVAVGPDGGTLAVGAGRGTVELLDSATLRRRGGVRLLRSEVLGAAIAPDGRLLAASGAGGEIRLADLRTGRPAGALRGLRANVQAVAFSPDGRLLAAAEVDTERPRMLLWDVRTGRPTGVEAGTTAVSLAFSPDGRRIAAAAADQGTLVLDVRSGRRVARLPAAGLARSVAFSPDGALLFVGQYDGRGVLHRTSDWRPVGRRLEGHLERVTYPSFSPDGRVLATASGDGTVALWDVATQKPLGPRLPVGRGDAFTSAVLTPDGRHLLATSNGTRGVRLPTDPAVWARHACRIAGRELTPAEWADVLPGRDHRAVCR